MKTTTPTKNKTFRRWILKTAGKLFGIEVNFSQHSPFPLPMDSIPKIEVKEFEMITFRAEKELTIQDLETLYRYPEYLDIIKKNVKIALFEDIEKHIEFQYIDTARHTTRGNDRVVAILDLAIRRKQSNKSI